MQEVARAKAIAKMTQIMKRMFFEKVFLHTRFSAALCKRMLFLWLSIWLSMGLSAKTIHWVTFFDTNDEHVGEMDINGRNILYNRFVNVINSSLSLAGYNSDVSDFYGDDVIPEKCNDVIGKLKCDASDIIVFYYVGHGFHSADDVTDYPTMVLGTKAITEKSIPLSWVHNKLKGKGARLVITIGACSNVITQGLSTALNSFSISKNSQSVNTLVFSDTGLSAIQQAFLCNKGEIIMCAASLGQSAFGGATSMGSIDFLTAALVTTFDDMTYEKNFSWGGFLNETSYIIKEMTNGMQTPLFFYNLEQSPIPE